MSKQLKFDVTDYDVLLLRYFNKNISQRQLILYIRKYHIDRVITDTKFLNMYSNENRCINILERLYYIINHIDKPIICPYCKKNLCSWSGNINEGYNLSCSSKDCISKLHSEKHDIIYKKTILNLLLKFKLLEYNVTDVNDDIIIKLFYPDKRGYKLLYGLNISNPLIIRYLNNRYKDSNDIEETIRRIKLGIEEKPKCPTCGKPVNFIGKPNKLYTTYCSNKCAANAEEIINKKQITDKCNHNGVMGWVLSNSNSTKIELRKLTMLNRYGTTNVYNVPEFHKKAINTSYKHYGTAYPLLNPMVLKAHWEKVIKNNKCGFWTSKKEIEIRDFLLKYYPDLKWQYIDERYYNPNNNHKYVCDFYIPSKDLFIEYLGYYTHHYHPYNPNNKEDIEELISLKKKAEYKAILNNKIGCKYNGYLNTILIWTQSDPLKREVTKILKLKLLEIWPDYTLADILLNIENF